MVLFTLNQITQPINQSKMKKCEECDGEGYYDVGPECDKPASMCCGGCYENVECSICLGTGEIYED